MLRKIGKDSTGVIITKSELEVYDLKRNDIIEFEPKKIEFKNKQVKSE